MVLKAETIDAGVERVMTAFGDRVLVPVAIPAAPLIGPRCRHMEPFGPHGYTASGNTCPICGDKIRVNQVLVDAVALAIRRLVVAHPGYRRNTAAPEMAAELAPARRPAGGGPANAVVVVYSEEGWSVPGGTDVFRFADLATDVEALAWLNSASSDEVAELPGVGPVTAMTMAAYMPVEGPLASVAARFIGPRRAGARAALTAALRAFKLRQSAPPRRKAPAEASEGPGGSGGRAEWPRVGDPRLPQPPPERAEGALVAAVYHRAAQGYSPGGAAVVAAIAARLHREGSPGKAAMWIAAVHADDVDAAVAVYRQVWPGSAASVAHFLGIIEPHLRVERPCNTLAVVGYDPVSTPPNQAIRRHNRLGTSRAPAEAAAAARMLARRAALDAVQRIYGAAAPAATEPCGATATTPTSGGSPGPRPSSAPPTVGPRPPPPPSPLGPGAPTSPSPPRSTPSPPSAAASPLSATTPPGCLGTPPPRSSSTAPGSC